MSKCTECGAGVVGIKVKEHRLNSDIHDIPFFCAMCNAIKLDYWPTGDKVVIFQDRVAECFGDSEILIPESYKEFYIKGRGVILAIGPGYWKQKGVFRPTQLKVGQYVLYNKEVPSRIHAIANTGKEYELVLCGEQDIWMTIDND